MNTAQTSPLIDSLRDWSMMAAGGSLVKHVVTPQTTADALALMEKALLLPAWFGRKKIGCRVSSSSDVVKNGFKITAGGSEFHVKPVEVPFKGKRPQAVTATSREAYHALDINAACTEVVKSALEMGDTYDRALAAKMGKESGYISARRNDLKNMGEFNYLGKKYRVEYTVKRPCLVTGKTVQWWRIVDANAQQTLFQ